MPNSLGKVIVVSDGLVREHRPEANFPHHPQLKTTTFQLMKLWELILHLERTRDGGVEFDTVIVCNGPWAYAWWKKYDATQTKNGRFNILDRENVGGSFGGYNYAYKHTTHDGFIFTEEDILIFGDQYYKKILDAFTGDVGFVGLVGISRYEQYPTHCHGGVGYTTREVLNSVAVDGNLSYHEGTTQRNIILEGEIPFTNNIVKTGRTLTTVDNYIRRWDIRNMCYPFAMFTPDTYADLGIEWYYP
jgi:hypothetical protein